MTKPTCRSCGAPFADHLGLEPTCERLVEMRDAVSIAREGRDTAESRAKEAVQAEMAALRARRCPRCKESPPAAITGPVLFLDVDGVLNDHRFTGIDRSKCEILNAVITNVPSLTIVISSAWRHEIIDGDMTLRGFATMLRACGLRCAGKIVGYTHDDGNDFENDGRANLIRRFAAQHKLTAWAAIDDMDLALPDHRFVRTDGDVGIIKADAEKLVVIFTGAAERKAVPE